MWHLPGTFSMDCRCLALVIVFEPQRKRLGVNKTQTREPTNRILFRKPTQIQKTFFFLPRSPHQAPEELAMALPASARPLKSVFSGSGIRPFSPPIRSTASTRRFTLKIPIGASGFHSSSRKYAFKTTEEAKSRYRSGVSSSSLSSSN